MEELITKFVDTNRARKSHILLVNGYFTTNFSSTTPIEIVRICLLYTFLLEGFDKTQISQNINIDGLDNTICKCTKASPKESCLGFNIIGTHHPNKTSKITEGQYCRIQQLDADNLLTLPHIVKLISFNEKTQHWRVKIVIGADELDEIEVKEDELEVINNYHRYNDHIHWRFIIHKLCGLSDGGLLLGIVENNTETLLYRGVFENKSVNPSDYVDVYLDLNLQHIVFIKNGCEYVSEYVIKNSLVGYRFCVQFIESIGRIELIEYHESNWYKKSLRTFEYDFVNWNLNTMEALALGRLAVCSPNRFDVYFKIALRHFPNVQRWIDGLLFSTIWDVESKEAVYLSDYEECYQLALFYQTVCKSKGKDSILYLAELHFKYHSFDKAVNLFRLLDETCINKNELYDAFAYCLAECGLYEDAIKYHELHEKQCSNDEKMQMQMDQLGLCYENNDDIKAIDCYQKSLQESENERMYKKEFIQQRLAILHSKQNDLDSAKQCYERIIKDQPDDFQSYYEYAKFTTACKNEEEAIKLYQKALEIALRYVDGENDKTALLTIINCYMELNDINARIKYLEIYLTTYDENDEDSDTIDILKDCYRQAENNDNVLLCLDKLLKITPNSFEYNFEYAELLRIYEKNAIKANKYYKKTIDIGKKLLLENENENKEIENETDNNNNNIKSEHIYEMLSICFKNLE
eukprot:492253_1